MARKGLLIGGTIILLLAAAQLAFRPAVRDDAPADQYLDFACTSCQHQFRLSQREFERLWDRGEYVRIGDRRLGFRCPSCGRMTAERTPTDGAAPAAPTETSP